MKVLDNVFSEWQQLFIPIVALGRHRQLHSTDGDTEPLFYLGQPLAIDPPTSPPVELPNLPLLPK